MLVQQTISESSVLEQAAGRFWKFSIFKVIDFFYNDAKLMGGAFKPDKLLREMRLQEELPQQWLSDKAYKEKSGKKR